MPDQPTTPTEDRTPYVGAGEDGCRRSANVDRDEADGLDYFDARRDELLASAERWEEQAYRLMLVRMGERPTLNDLRMSVGSEEWLAAIALLDLSPALAADAGQWTEWARTDGRFSYEGEGEDRVSTFHPDCWLDWEGWAANVEDRGRGWSGTEARLYEVVAALTTGKAITLTGVLNGMNSWEREVLDVLVQWASGGNNRDRPGRLTVTDGLLS